MASEAAKAVAKEVVENVRNGVIPNKGKIIRKHGYSESISRKPKRVTETKSYKSVTDPHFKRMLSIRDKILDAMDGKDLTEEQFKTLSDSLAKINHDIQLLSGGVTEDIKISWE